MINLSNVTHTFSKGTPNETAALKDIHIKIGRNTFAAIVGPNGSGKSTLLNVIAGTIQPDAGTVEIDGKNVTRLPEFRRSFLISRVFQNPLAGTASELSILDNFRLAAIRTGAKKLVQGITPEFIQTVKDRIAVLGIGLENKLHQPVGALSGGQRQALTLLMAVMDKSSVLLMDEPTAALDPGTATTIMELAAQLTRENELTTVMVTHSLRDAEKYGSHVVLMQEGAIHKQWHRNQQPFVTAEELLKFF